MTAAEFPLDVVEAVARALHDPPGVRPAWSSATEAQRKAFHWPARAALAALPPAARAVLTGQAVAVPMEATDAMKVAGKNSEWGWREGPNKIDCHAVWVAMSAASPWAPRDEAGS